MNSKTIVLNIGGSILSLSDEVLFDFKKANEIKNALLPLVQEGYKFILPVGGGYICRKYQNLLRENSINDVNVDYAGIAAINLNAVMLRSVFGDLAEEKILRYEDFDSDEELSFEKSDREGAVPDPRLQFMKNFVISAAGSKVGRSSDWDTVHLAVRAKADKVLSLSNIDGVYTADPKKDPTAKRLDSLTWVEYKNIIGNPTEFEPGGHYPIDVVAANLAQENKISFCLLDRNDLGNLVKAIKGENFVGTTIS